MENTSDEAVAVKEIISKSKRIILVTPAYHMYRAKRLFENQEFKVVTYKIGYKIGSNLIKTYMNFCLVLEI